MTLHKHFTSLLVVASLVAASTVIADTIASKIEAQGEMTYLKVTELRQTVRNGLLTIQAEVTNRHTGQQTMYYRFRWLDETGFSVWGDEPWKPVLFHGRDKQLIQVVAPTPQATDFRLVVQSPENESPSAAN